MSVEERQALVRYFLARFDHAVMQRHRYRHAMGVEGVRLCDRAAFDAILNMKALLQDGVTI